MSRIQEFTAFRDKAGNIYKGAPQTQAGDKAQDLLGTSANVSVAVGSAAVVALTLAGATGKFTKLENLTIRTAGFTGDATSSTVFGTVYDGTPTTTVIGNFVISQNVNLQDALAGINATSATSGNGISVHISAGATGVSVAAIAKKSYVTAADL